MCRGQAAPRIDRALLPQRESEQRVPRSHCYVLPAVDGVSHGSGGDRASDGSLPQQRAIAGVQCEEVSFAAAAEQQVRSGGQDAGVGDVVHLELPFPLTGAGVQRPDRPVALVFLPEILTNLCLAKGNLLSGRSSSVSPALFVLLAIVLYVG